MDDLFCLIDEIRPIPIIALFVSRRKVHYTERINPISYEEWTGGYPHFVDNTILEMIRQKGIPIIEVRSDKGLPFRVFHWETLEPASVFPWQEDPSLNTYYPSQEIHEEIAEELLKHPKLKRLLNK